MKYKKIYTTKYLNLYKPYKLRFILNILGEYHMNINIRDRKPIVLWITLLLLLGLNLTTTVSSAPVQYNDDGIWFDTFDDDLTGISESDACVLSNGSIKLNQGIDSGDYDFSDGAGHQAWDANVSSIFGDDEQLIRMKNLFGQRAMTNYDVIAAKDGDVFETQARSIEIEPLGLIYTFSPVHHFRFKISQNKNNIDYFTFAWWHGPKTSSANVESIHLYIWNYSALLGIGTWEHVGSLDSYANIGSDPDGDIHVTISNGEYTSDDSYMDFLIVALPDPNEYGEPCILRTDYVSLTVKNEYGYLEDGYVISETISPSPLGRWESVVWSSSKTSEVSDVTIQVLKSNGSLIINAALPGNEDGFTSIPVDLSPLPTSISKIKIKAMLHSNDLLITPKLHSWGVTWQTNSNKFQDSFKTDLRTEKIIGATLTSGQIKISTSSGGWPLVGKTSENTRSYEGYGPSNDSLYWYTTGQTVGGGLRSPIVSDDGKLYIPSSVDGKIHAFTAKVPSSEKGKELAPAYNSSSSYIVDAAIAVAGDYVIVATSEINASNKIYALDKTTLDEAWSYSYSSNDICFSSAPTVSEDKIFITSWNGKEWDTPLLSFLYELQILQGNNKVIALNLVDGTELWTADLPAGSFSTPAVADGMVFVGCDKITGNSLFAFDEETGTKLWEASVGLIGGASPVVHNDKVFVVAKEQNLLSLKGDITLLALDEYNGTILWNKTIAENIPAYESLPKVLRLYNLLATSTPAIQENKVFVTSPDGKLYAFRASDGEELWNVDLSSAMYGIIPTYSCNSPVATYDKVYVASPNGVVSAVSMSGTELWDCACKVDDENFLTPMGILASPIVVDGVLYVSLTEGVTEELDSLNGRIYSIGDDLPNLRARVVSKPIRVPAEKWWNKFEATTTGEGNISFSILDEDYNVLIDEIKDGDNISDITTNMIRLVAEFARERDSQHPSLSEWSVTFKGNPPPVLDEDSFIPDKSGWINTNTPVCSITAYDTMPGLNVDSAHYKITYLTDKDKEKTTDWIKANCTGDVGSTKNETITMDISALNISTDIARLKTIQVKIADLAGNTATFQPEDEFKLDMVKPSSEIDNVNSFSSKYNTPVTITANASDHGDNKSGVKWVTLCYRISGTWEDYEKVSSPYSWSFAIDQSGTYEFCTIATDRAGNVEGYPAQGELSFLFDMNEPDKPEFGNLSRYKFNGIPEFSGERNISFSDDIKLKSIEYRLNFHGINNWTMIDDDINSKTYDKKWNLTQDDWDYMIEGENYSIYFRVTDSCGNQYISSEEDALTIIQDLTASTSYLDLSNFEEWHWDNEFTITADIPDDSDVTNVKLYYQYSANNNDWGDWKQYGDEIASSPFTWDFTATDGSGYYKFKTMVWDAAGNVGESTPEVIEVTLFPMIPLIIVAVLAMILIIVTAYIITTMKKKKA